MVNGPGWKRANACPGASLPPPCKCSDGEPRCCFEVPGLPATIGHGQEEGLVEQVRRTDEGEPSDRRGRVGVRHEGRQEASAASPRSPSPNSRPTRTEAVTRRVEAVRIVALAGAVALASYFAGAVLMVIVGAISWEVTKRRNETARTLTPSRVAIEPQKRP